MLRLFLIALVLSISAYSNIIEISDKTSYKEILSNSSIYIDKNNEQSLDVILANNAKFISNTKSILGYGYSPDFSVWIKLTLKNISKNKVEKIIEYNNALTTSVIFYSPKNNYSDVQKGLLHLGKINKTINPIFSISLEANETQTYYIKASSKITTLIVKLNLWDNSAYHYGESQHKLILGMFFGAMLVLAIYNFFVFIFTKDISYLYYVFYICGLSFHHFLYVGLSNIYLNQEFLILCIKYVPIIIALPVFALGLFTKTFLSIKQYKKINIMLNILLFLVPIYAVLLTLIEGYTAYRNILTSILLLYLVLVTIYAVYKKNRQAYFILFGWCVIFAAVILMVLSSSGVFNVYEYFSYPIESAFLLEVVIFSIALADKINKLKSLKENLSKKIINQKESENKRLEENVKLKTHDLNIVLIQKELLLKELNHRVKNNMQMMVSLIRLQCDETNNEEFVEVLNTIKNRINAMSQLHELLYQKDNISGVDTYEYFSLIVSELSETYEKNEKVDINLNINCNLETEDLLYCGLILNELITNSFKYAFNNSGEINITLFKNNSSYFLEVKDNGVGYDSEIKTGNLGLVLINSLVLDQLDGELDYSTNKGVNTKIKWSCSEGI